jgi:hypothetical protein
MLENLKKVEAEKNLGGGDYFKPQNGNNIIRVLSEGVYHESTFKGNDGVIKTTKKFVMFVIDRKDGKVKPYFAPYTIYKKIANLEADPFYKFEGMPMPYDINVKVENAGTLNAEYDVIASPNRAELTGEEIAAAREKGSIADYVKGLSEKDGKSEPVEFSDGSPVPNMAPAGKPAPDFLQ